MSVTPTRRVLQDVNAKTDDGFSLGRQRTKSVLRVRDFHRRRTSSFVNDENSVESLQVFTKSLCHQHSQTELVFTDDNVRLFNV